MTVRNVAWLASVLGMSACSIAGPPRAQSAPRNAGSCAATWSEPRPLRVRRNVAFLERPAVVSLRGRALLLGPRAFVSDSLGRPVNPLMAPGAHYIEGFDEIPMGVISDGAATWDWVSMPPRVRSAPWLPRAVVDSGGVAHVVWASSDSVVDDTPPTVPSIWYARFDGSHWSNPVRVAWGHRYYWSSANVSQLVMHNGTLHLAVSTMGEGITYLRQTDGTWTAHHIAALPPEYFGYPGLAVMPSGRIVLVVQSPPERVRNGIGSGVAVTRSDDGGLTWTPPQHISTPDQEPAYDHQLLLDPAGRLHAVWFQQTDSLGNPARQANISNSPGRVHIAESSDAGVTWQVLAPTALLQNADGLQTFQMDDGSLIVGLADRLGERILLTSWRGSWQLLASIDARPNPFHPAFGWGDAQRPVLTWGSRRAHEWVVTLFTTLGSCP